MTDVSRPRQRVRPRPARVAATLALTAGLLASCSTETTDPEAAQGRTARESATTQGGTAAATPSRAPETTTRAARVQLPEAPATRSPATLARQLTVATATLRDRNANPADVRRAGEFQQLAVHTLVTGSKPFRRKVSSRLRPQAAMLTRGAVKAGRLLRAMTSPQPTLPRWRIVPVPPAPKLRAYYRRAQRRTGVPWNYLAAIHLVETRMGRIRGTSTAGARGPMQFLPSTWDLYGRGGDINDPRDAILAAGRLLRHHGAPRDMAGALWHYNPSRNYVRAVTAHARTMRRATFAYRGYWSWRVFYRHRRGTHLLPLGYPREPAVLLRRL
jgi:Transglycosylase SLT domain